MIFRHDFRVEAPLAAVGLFHRHRDSLPAITPPPVRVRVDQAPELLSEGDRLAMRLQLGPLSVRWLAQIEEVSELGFSDRQLEGPFASWVHRHLFVRCGDQSTQVYDCVEATLRRHPLWGPLGTLMWLSLPFLFAYRGWQTRRLLRRAA